MSSNNCYDGSVDIVSGIAVGVSGFIPPSMTENGWQFRDYSKSDKTVLQYSRRLENGRHDEIRLNNHKKERVHYHIKIMIKETEKPTKVEFMTVVGPELKKSVKKVLEKWKE